MSMAVAFAFANRYTAKLGLMEQPPGVLLGQACLLAILAAVLVRSSDRLGAVTRQATVWRNALLFLQSYLDMGIGVVNVLLVTTLVEVSDHYTSTSLASTVLTAVLVSLVSAFVITTSS